MESSSAGAAVPLTVAEALVLRAPNKDRARAALKLTLIDLLARGVLLAGNLKRRRLSARRISSFTLARDAAQRVPRSPHVDAVISMLAATCGPLAVVAMEDLVAAARRSFGPRLETFQDLVLRALLARGLIEQREERALLIFRTTRYRHTPAGEAALRKLEAEIAQARGIPAYLDRDPAQAAALALALGSTLLLVDELRPHFDRLSRELRSRRPDSGAAVFAPDTGPAWDDGERWDVDPAAFDGLDSSLAAFDDGFSGGDWGDGGSDSGGDGGGDGGGGD